MYYAGMRQPKKRTNSPYIAQELLKLPLAMKKWTKSKMFLGYFSTVFTF
jgi:hypothetical protein